MQNQQLEKSLPVSDVPWRKDTKAIACTMASYLSGLGAPWANMEPDDVYLENCSGLGGGDTYKIIMRASPRRAEAVLHILPEALCREEERELHFDRISQGQILLSLADLCPKRLCEDPLGFWYVEEYLGDSLASMESTADFVVEVADVLAKLHDTDICWGADIQRAFRQRFTGLTNASAGNHVWWFATKPYFFIDQVSDSALSSYVAVGPTPRTAAGSRLVVSHGDIHLGNLVRSNGRLKLIDLESLIVNYAIHDLCYASGMFCSTFELRQAFANQYLISSAQSSEPEDVHCLMLDIERCRMATNHYDENSPWHWLGDRSSLLNFDRYKRYVHLANHLNSQEAETIVSEGFEKCNSAIELDHITGKAKPGVVVTLHNELTSEPSRGAFLVNWDGSIQLASPYWRGLVLGINNQNEVVLTHHSDESNLLRLDMRHNGFQVTGMQKAVSTKQSLRLSGCRKGRALVMSKRHTMHFQNRVGYVTEGPESEAMEILFEPDGLIRLAEDPRRGFQCTNDRTTSGTHIVIYPLSPGSPRFFLQEDKTISPIENDSLVIGMRDDELLLVEFGNDDQLHFDLECDPPAQFGRFSTFPKKSITAGALPQILSLSSHPGCAISLKSGMTKKIGRLALTPEANAHRFFIGSDYLCTEDQNYRLTLGCPD